MPYRSIRWEVRTCPLRKTRPSATLQPLPPLSSSRTTKTCMPWRTLISNWRSCHPRCTSRRHVQQSSTNLHGRDSSWGPLPKQHGGVSHNHPPTCCHAHPSPCQSDEDKESPMAVIEVRDDDDVLTFPTAQHPLVPHVPKPLPWF